MIFSTYIIEPSANKNFLHITKDPPLLAHYGEICGVFCGFKLTFIFCHSHRSDVNNTVEPLYNTVHYRRY